MQIWDVEKYWDNRPCNIKHSPADFDTDGLRYSRDVSLRKYVVEPHILEFAEHWRWRHHSVLDLGCGIGTDTLQFAKYGAQVTATDISSVSLRMAQRRAGLEGYTGIRFVRWDMEQPRRDWDGQFDLVWAFGTIHHTPHPHHAIMNVRQWLAPGGLFRLMLYHRKSTKVARIIIKHLPLLLKGKTVDQIVALESEAQSGCPITYTYCKDSARELLESNGFYVRDMKVAHIFPWNVKRYVNYEYVYGFPWNAMPYRLYLWLEKHLGWHLLIEAVRK